MVNSYAIGFVAVAGVLVAGVDYFDQSKKAGFSLGQMPLSAYAETVPGRFNAAKAETAAATAEKERKSAWRRGGAEYLPEAPEGWTRRALLEGDDSAIMPPPEKKKDDGAGETLLQQMEGKKKVKEAKERATRSFVYERGNETVFVEVDLREKPDNNSMIGLVASVLTGADFGHFKDRLGYDTIGGVGFVERLTQDGKRKYHYRILEGRIGFGDEVTVRVHANAGSASTNEILSRIDYDGLNRLLPVPMAGVGNDATLPDGIAGADMALAMDTLHDEFVSLRAREAQYRIENIDTNALIVNTYAQQFGGTVDLMDITGGQDVNLGMLIDAAYHVAAKSVRSGKSAAEVKADVNRMVETVVVLADAEAAAMASLDEEAPAPEMSPELAAELGLDVTAPSVAGTSAQALNATATDRDGPLHAANLGQVLMEIDTKSTDAAGGMAISMTVDPDSYDAFIKSHDASEAEMELGLMVVARAFEDRHALPVDSCAWVAHRYRLECEAARGTRGGAVAGLLGKITGKIKGDGGALSAQEPAGLTTGEKPTRLQLSNSGQSGGTRCVGSFCD
ncbi:hypothetical protein [Roseovarius aestuariivivens]|uniref:hypothetical protein n=1 Tax=Roseovarius aestuariivivens TaxID=1888910 RepID=UPI0010810821|nr:hypothetical protein [Roseovarius aestuariivivens]